MKELLRILVPVGVLAAGIAIFATLKATKPEAEKKERDRPGQLVEYFEASTTKRPVRVSANGQVIPSKQISVVAEVGGRVVWMNPDLVPGGRLRKGDRLARIDSRDYQLAVEQQQAQVKRARTELQLEESRKKIAEAEWKLMGEEPPADEGSLALRDPQLKTAQVAVKAAESGLRQAQLAVQKTGLTAPFNAMVQQKNVDEGQLVGPSVPLATLVGTDAFWVQVSIPVDRLRWIEIPGVGAVETGSEARITQQVGAETISRTGRVVRLLGDLDPVGRMARVLVAIDDPLGLESPTTGGTPQLPLLLGSYVEVDIEGRDVADVYEIPRAALRDGNKVFVLKDDMTLGIKPVEVLWREPEVVLVSAGLSAGDKVISSILAAPVEGMKLRVPGEETRKAESRAPAGPSGKEATEPVPSADDAPAAGEDGAGKSAKAAPVAE